MASTTTIPNLPDGGKTPRLVWKHPHPERTHMYRFKRMVEKKRRLQLAVVDETAPISHIPRWFPGVTLNFAENILYTASPSPSPSPSYASTRSTQGKEDSKTALISVREGSTSVRSVTWGTLRQSVAQMALALKKHGVRKGDRVAVVASHSAETLIVFLAATAVGGVFSSSSTDMGVSGVLERLVQIRPVWVFVDDGAVYNGKRVDLRGKMAGIVSGMRNAGVEEFRGVVSQARFGGEGEEGPADVSAVPGAVTWAEFVSVVVRNDDDDDVGKGEMEFERVGFSDPFLIVYSSGTTGQPKCIVHSTGGVVLSAFKEGRLHRETGAESVCLQYTTTGWIMYLASVQALLFGARVVMYDGSPFVPDSRTFVRLVGELRVTHLGISPRWLQEIQKNNISPREVTDLSALRVVTSTGMVLSDALFEWFYDVGFPPRVQLANISGGTDLAGAFGTENSLMPVYVGGCQGPSLGIPIAVYDQLIEGGKGVKGKPVPEGVPGELVATAAFPNMPVKFWGDDDGSKYFNAYFARFDEVWTHGDFVMIHPVTKGLIFLGRADGVLNPSGVRFGSAEIYSILEAQFSEQIADSICVGQRRPQDNDESVMLFLMMKPRVEFRKELVNDVKTAIRQGLSARHVPRYVFETPDIPTTVNLKKVELPVKQIVSGKTIKPSGTLLNPQSLDYYYQFAKVEELSEPKSKL
ncbi:MAG: hypothetical protein M1830_005777 [Pleopsidium flavum]|nr:MAG: hypothetical protein M1830_005777 [Pleopsidium flavum]